MFNGHNYIYYSSDTHLSPYLKKRVRHLGGERKNVHYKLLLLLNPLPLRFQTEPPPGRATSAPALTNPLWYCQIGDVFCEMLYVFALD